jgi:CBS domain-containing protein
LQTTKWEEESMLVHEAMTLHAEWVTPDMTLKDAAQRMRDQGIGCLPIGEEDRLVGMLTDRDLACRAVAQGLDAATTKVGDVMTKGITWCFDDETMDDVVERMEQKQIHHLPVLNRQKRMIGILSLSDLALRGPQALSGKVFVLASRDATRRASRPH